MGDPNLIQLTHNPKDDWFPWRCIVISQLCQRTTGHQVRMVLPELFNTYPTPGHLAVAAQREVADVVKRCGFTNRRSANLVRVSQQYEEWRAEFEPEPRTTFFGPPPALVNTWQGCGKYVEEAYRIVVLDDLTFEPEDKELKAWWKFRTGK